MNKNIKILIVDDHSMIRNIVKNLFQHLGYVNITEADDGLTALPLLQKGGFDLLVTDWMMPGMQGIDLIKAVRKDRHLSSLPVLLLTAESKREQIVEAMNAGVNGYVVKPFTSKRLMEKLEFIFETIEAAA